MLSNNIFNKIRKENKITEKDLNRLLIKGTVTKRYYTDPYLLKRAIRISHPILFIISLLAIWRLRFCITAVIIKSFNRIKSERNAYNTELKIFEYTYHTRGAAHVVLVKQRMPNTPLQSKIAILTWQRKTQ